MTTGKLAFIVFRVPCTGMQSIHPFLVQISDDDLCRDLITGMDCEFVMNYDAWGEVSNLVTSSPLTRLISRSHAGRSNRSLISRSTAGDRRYAPSIPRHSPAHTAFLYHQDQFWWVFSLISPRIAKKSLISPNLGGTPTPGGEGVFKALPAQINLFFRFSW